MKTEIRTVTGFHAIQLSNAGRLVLTQNGKEGVKVTAEDNVMPAVKTEVVNGVLKLYVDLNNVNSKGVDYVVDAKVLDRIVVEGASTIQVHQFVGNKLNISATGASSIALEGRVDELECKADGASRVDAADLTTKNARISMEGASSGVVNVSDQLTIDATGAASIGYIGSPKLEKRVSGAASVYKK